MHATVPAILEKLHAGAVDQLKYYDFLNYFFHAISQDYFNTKLLVFGRAKHCQGLREKQSNILMNSLLNVTRNLKIKWKNSRQILIIVQVMFYLFSNLLILQM
jgi:hypothetical protein